MRTGDKIMTFCGTPKTAQQLAEYCKVQRSSIYSALGRLQMKGLLMRVGDGVEPATYVLTKPTTMQVCENLMVKHAHNPFGLRP